MDAEEALKWIGTQDITLIDIRQEDDFKEAHIKNAFNLNQSNAEEFLRTADKEKLLICYCYHGISSQGACEFLRAKGFKNVHSLDGGFEGWRVTFPETVISQ